MKKILITLCLLPVLGSAQQLKFTFSADPAVAGKCFIYNSAGDLAGTSERSGEGLTILRDPEGRVTGYEQATTPGEKTWLLDASRRQIGYKLPSRPGGDTVIVYSLKDVPTAFERKVPGWDRRELYTGSPK